MFSPILCVIEGGTDFVQMACLSFFVDPDMMLVVKAVNVAQDGVRSKMCALHHPHTMADVRVGSQRVLSQRGHSPNVADRRGFPSPTHVRKDVRLTSAHSVGPLRALGVGKWCRAIAPFLFFLTRSRFQLQRSSNEISGT